MNEGCCITSEMQDSGWNAKSTFSEPLIIFIGFLTFLMTFYTLTVLLAKRNVQHEASSFSVVPQHAIIKEVQITLTRSNGYHECYHWVELKETRLRYCSKMSWLLLGFNGGIQLDNKLPYAKKLAHLRNCIAMVVKICLSKSCHYTKTVCHFIVFLIKQQYDPIQSATNVNGT